jgi:hypothetical protein
MEDEVDATIEHVANLITILISTVHPGINEDVTYDLLLDMFEKDLTVAGVETYGRLIRASAGSPSNDSFH